jgi:hypothetical protein
MSTHCERIVVERDELSLKISKLEAFIKTNPLFDILPLEEQTLLNQQLDYMDNYRYVLNKRIDICTSTIV